MPKLKWYESCHLILGMIRRILVILVLYGIAITEVYCLSHYGVEWLLAGLALTAFLAGHWIRANWYSSS